MNRKTLVCFCLGLGIAACQQAAPSPHAATGSSKASLATLPAGFVDSLFAAGLNHPTAMQFCTDGRLFVCEQGGTLRVIKNGQLLPTPFVTVPVDTQGERGLLGVACDPNFASNSFVYVYYTATSPTLHNRVSRFTANGDTAVPGSEAILLDLNDLLSGIHNGGALHFGPDGKLYIGVGENGAGTNSQDLSNLLGKLLRINPDGSIPNDNPFLASTNGKNGAIWAIGLRNPFTFAFQRTTGRLFIDDVGQNTWEEIDDGKAGGNYGWPASEGPTNDPSFIGPLFYYGHGNTSTTGCAIVGGAFYNPLFAQFPSSYIGQYFFSDYCTGWIRQLNPATATATDFASGLSSPVDLQVGSDGSLYYLTRADQTNSVGQVGRISYTANQSQPPVVTSQPADVAVAVGQGATFSCSASGTGPVAYQWQRNRVDISGATGDHYTLLSAAPSDSGVKFRCHASNPYGDAFSAEATLTVLSARPPTATIVSPASGTFYAAGDTISYLGSGTDPQDGSLPASAFTWQVDFHHDTHLHPFIPATPGAKGGSFVIPTVGETSANVWYRILLTVTDSAGLTNSTYVDVLPRKSNITFASIPSGLQLTLDGQPQATPFTVTGVVGIQRTLGVVSPQTVNGQTYVFDRWSDSGAQTHAIGTPSIDVTYAASFVPAASTHGLTGEYFFNPDLTSLAFIRVDPVVDILLNGAAPDPSLNPDSFSIRWTGQVQAQFSETYILHLTSDDGVRLWMNGQLLINDWSPHSWTEDTATLALNAGQRNDLVLDYFQAGGYAVAKLEWESPSTPKEIIPQAQLWTAIAATDGGTPDGGPPDAGPPDAGPPDAGVADAGTGGGDAGTRVPGLKGQYFIGMDLTQLAFTQIDPEVNFAWNGAPDPRLPAERFSIRWTGSLVPLYRETYTFYTDSDDGVRLWVNGQLLINNWTDHGWTEDQATLALSAGQAYDLRLEYYQNTLDDAIKLLWSSPSQAREIVPTPQLSTPP